MCEDPESDLGFFLCYLLARLDFQHDLDETQVCHLADLLPNLLIGIWLNEPIPSDFLDYEIPSGVYVQRITHIETSDYFAVSDPDEPQYSWNRELRSWMWLVAKATNGIR
jgi:hypothetical protein